MQYFTCKQNAVVQKEGAKKVHRKAFTLIETFVAVSVLMTALVGPLTISQKSLALSGYSRDKMTAYYLAQDAVEYIRGLRDDNAKQGSTWSSFVDLLSACQAANNQGGCQVNSSIAGGGPNAILPCGALCVPMNYNIETGLYTTEEVASTIVPSVFTRSVVISSPPYDPSFSRELFMTVKVTWKNDGIDQSYSVVQDLFDW